MQEASDDLVELINARIEALRPKLLDLSRRNPLVSTKLSTRTNALIRVIDELPDVLFFNLNNAAQMRFVPLPALDDDPLDEQGEDFVQALANARLTDSDYLTAIDKLDSSCEDYADQSRQLERVLKDKVRAQVGLSPRPERKEINLVQHARNNGIAPSYDLPNADGADKGENHTDQNIQTLFLPKDLERKLSALNSKCNTWIQETGINVLHAAFGFLEWKEPDASEASFAPLILLQVKFERRKTKEGLEFWVTGVGEEAEVNTVLFEKLRLEFGVQLPPFEGGSVEAYLHQVGEISPKTLTWRVRRQVAFGVFPSARIAMYHDLNTQTSSFASSDVIRPLFGGNGSGGSVPFADEYLVDQPEFERKVPHLVLDADASQFSTLVDVATGANVAVEGPPGTGKSQTIVNAIAAALASGKKVLFVSEKTAALDVVRSRLEAIGLGEFLLPLLAERSTRENVISSIRERVEMATVERPKFYELQVANFRSARDETAQYIQILTTKFEDCGLTVHEIIGKSIITSSVLDALPKELQLAQFPISQELSQEAIRDIAVRGGSLFEAWQKVESFSPLWKGIRKANLNRFDVDEISEIAKRLSSNLAQVHERVSALGNLGLRELAVTEDITPLKDVFEFADKLNGAEEATIAARVAQTSASNELRQFLEDCRNFSEQISKLQGIFQQKISETTLEAISELESICRAHELEKYDDSGLAQKATMNQKVATMARSLAERMRPFAACVPASENWRLSALKKIREIVESAGPEVVYFRSAAFADPTAPILLKRYNKVGRELIAEREPLLDRISFVEDISLDELQSISASLRAGGFFRGLSGEYRRAKKRFLRISKTKFRRDDVVAVLDQLIDWKRRESDFMRDPHVASLYGAHFRGVETDFGLFDRLAKYFESAREAFPSLEETAIRDFLFSGSADHVLQVPVLEMYPDMLSLKMIEAKLGDIDAAATNLEAAANRVRELKNIFVRGTPADVASLPRLKDEIFSVLAIQRRLACDSKVANCLGSHFDGPATNVELVERILNVTSRLEALGDRMGAGCAIVASGNAATALVTLTELDDYHRLSIANERELVSRTGLENDSELLIGQPDGRAKLLAAAADERDGLFAHAEFARAWEAVPSAVHDLIDAYVRLTGSYQGIGQTLEALAFRSLARRAFEKYGNILAKFSGSKLNELRQRIATLDKEIITSSRQLVRSFVQSNAKPPSGIGIGRKSQYTDMALIENETSKKQRYIPVRDLTKRAGKALLELKPCWMMSPLAVAQYLPKADFSFDLCIIDEASQMTPEDAVGALSRCRQTMIVGDTNQLPPSNFFRKLVEDEDADEDETVLSESILEMANAVFRPARRLRWHYRSRHSGLIRFSNRLVYNDDLVVFPSATEAMRGMGVEFRAVQGLYKSGTNPLEAQAMVEAAIRFMNEYPNRSLGIVTLNQKQRDLIFEEMEHALSRDAAASRYVEDWSTRNEGLEQFFIKNLENVQGDERDVIFIGTVYGPESPGARVMQRFGPINGVAGKRRLNVLFSRAKQFIVTFSSMTASDITAEPTGNEGAYMLKCWLEYAATGTLDGGVIQEKEPDSDFEIFVMNQIRAMGCTPIPQVGVRGYSIDIGVKHPHWEHGFILGVECDGATFHSSKSARDRDRLRQEVLEGLGWKIHRIWSTDWFNSPAQQADILRRVIETRLAELKAKEKDFKVGPAKTNLDAGVKSFSSEAPPLQSNKEAVENTRAKAAEPGDVVRVAVGDTVRVRHLTDDKRVVQFRISRDQSDASNGVVYYKGPIAEALLGAEEGEEVEILVGSYLRPAVLEKIVARETV